jgi:magnesium transporter
MRNTEQNGDRSRRLIDLLGRHETTTTDPQRRPSTVKVTRLLDGELTSSETVGPDDSRAAVQGALAYADEDPQRMVILSYDSPFPEQIRQLESAWQLHPVLVEDLLKAGQRPKMERYGDVLFIVTRMASYADEIEDVQITEFHLMARRNAVAIIRQGGDSPAVDSADRLAHNRKLLKLGADAVLYSFLDLVVDGYLQVLRGLEVDREQIERQVFAGDPKVTERIYRLSREIIDLQQSSVPLGEVIADLRAGFSKYRTLDALRAYLQDVSDHLSRANTRVEDLRTGMNQILDVNSILVNQRQNEDMKKVSGWAAIGLAPTVIGAIYGMNFDVMPELHWAFGYPMALILMALSGIILWLIFKKKNWM